MILVALGIFPEGKKEVIDFLYSARGVARGLGNVFNGSLMVSKRIFRDRQ